MEMDHNQIISENDQGNINQQLDRNQDISPPTEVCYSRVLYQYKILRKLGEGTFGKVVLAIHLPTNEEVAIKIFNKETIINNSEMVRIDREIRILRRLYHTNIIRLYTCIQDHTRIFLIMEYAENGSLYNLIQTRQRIDEKRAREIFQQLILSVEYLHMNKIVHRDLKPENLLLDYKQHLKIADFGLSCFYKYNELLTTSCGSALYISPEILKKQAYKPLPADIWACGIILFQMVNGYLPFQEKFCDLLYKRITDGSIEPFHEDVSESCRNLITRILNVNPIKRITIDKIKENHWFTGECDFVPTPKISPQNYTKSLTTNSRQNLVKANLIKKQCEIKLKKFYGINLLNVVIPIDEQIVDLLYNEIHSYEKEAIRESILLNKCNSITTMYYLKVKKKIRNGDHTIADLSSEEFQKYSRMFTNSIKFYHSIHVAASERSNSPKINELYMIRRLREIKKRVNFKLEDIPISQKSDNPFIPIMKDYTQKVKVHSAYKTNDLVKRTKYNNSSKKLSNTNNLSRKNHLKEEEKMETKLNNLQHKSSNTNLSDKEVKVQFNNPSIEQQNRNEDTQEIMCHNGLNCKERNNETNSGSILNRLKNEKLILQTQRDLYDRKIKKIKHNIKDLNKKPEKLPVHKTKNSYSLRSDKILFDKFSVKPLSTKYCSRKKKILFELENKHRLCVSYVKDDYKIKSANNQSLTNHNRMDSSLDKFKLNSFRLCENMKSTLSNSQNDIKNQGIFDIECINILKMKHIHAKLIEISDNYSLNMNSTDDGVYEFVSDELNFFLFVRQLEEDNIHYISPKFKSGNINIFRSIVNKIFS